ncbi:nucleolar protein 14 homolog [Tribolium castaneum]|uniref:Nucleolar protein 14 homolog-like Protein n=1 Tax=Tribolium castaneum TaxID=7070 RepID=D6WZW5_TRICA|nr:PREDICTED: nucleolar protein 14 homolog [Tribolium castaneum]EFA10489.1 Nucleolar protein 14 homolog-like Protein [Tribolium castaneum]|eukprot:XP_974875.1 PREDICTED: nucleolar protein 14 homolog [Tribolium castaneum]
MKPRKKPEKNAPNPFEIHINKQKMTVLGQKNKNDRGLPGVSRAKALKKRKETLLQEYKLQNKSNKFTDRRIGERSRDLTSEDKLMARFTALRKKAHKKSIFNLADDEVLTHKGQTLAEIEKFDDPRSDNEDSDEDKSGKLDSAFVGDAHFGGGVLRKTGKEGAKTHRELIDELIAESKKRKAEKQRTKEATLELTEKLDTEWKDLLPLVSRAQKGEPDKGAVDDYDKVMRELRFEARGTVSDRLKSEDEVAQEEKQRLEELEEKRRERMRGFEPKTQKHRSADDLDDDVYEADPEYMLSYNTEGEANVEIGAEINGKTVGGEESDEEEECEEEEEEQSDDDLADLKAETSDESDEETEAKATKTDVVAKTDETSADLPFTFALPDSYEALQQLLDDKSSRQQATILERMVKCNHPSLAEKNKNGLGTLFVYLLQYLNDCASEKSAARLFEIYKSLAPHIFDLAQLNKENTHSSMLEVIKEKHDEFKKRPKDFPGLELLVFFKLVSLLFTTSDFRHQVVTPCFVFIEQILNKCKIKSGKDIAYGIFLVTLVLEYTSLSKRVLPTAINYLGGILHMAIPKCGVKLIKVNPPFKPTTSSLVLVEKSCEDCDFKMEASDLERDEINDSFKIRAIYTVLRLVQDFDNNLVSLPSNVEIFNDIRAYLELLPTRNYPKKVADLFESVSQQLKNRKVERKLEYIVLAAKRPKALRLYEPKIVEVFDGKKRKIQSREKAERDKLLHKLKKETKGALREIRRDKAFLGRVKIHQRIQSDNERKEKVKRIYAEASIQQSELNSLDRKKKRK